MSRKAKPAGHTPGPWSWRYDITDPYGLEGASGTDILRARDGMSYSEYTSDPATIEISKPEDAWLITAAPDLLAAVEAFIAAGDGHDDFAGEWAAARAAVAKAKTGSNGQ